VSVPQVVLVTGGPARCVACAGEIPRGAERYQLLEATGVAASAHVATFDDDDTEDDRCRRVLRRLWAARAARHGAHPLVLGRDGGGPRFHAGAVPLHAGTAVSVLTAAGTWIPGRFEYVLGDPPTPTFYTRLGGFDPRPAAIVIDPDVLVRIDD
jgi:hypothetical protein